MTTRRPIDNDGDWGMEGVGQEMAFLYRKGDSRLCFPGHTFSHEGEESILISLMLLVVSILVYRKDEGMEIVRQIRTKDATTDCQR